MSLYTFTDGRLVLKLSEREIYNDIRAQIDVTLTTVVTDSPPAAGGVRVVISKEELFLTAGNSGSMSVNSKIGDPPGLVWAVGGSFLTAGPGSYTETLGWDLPTTLSSSSDSSATYLVTNNKGVDGYVHTSGVYSYPAVGATTHSESNTQTLTVLTSNPDSIQKYGRRVMDLVWPQGQSQADTIALAEAYANKYSEPVPTLTYTVLGKTVALVEQIFTRRISDLITIQQPDIGLSADFFINSVSIGNSRGMVNATWGLEMARATGNN